MTHIRIVTDSNAHFAEPDFARRHQVHVLPLGVRLGDEVVPETALTTDQLFQRVAAGAPPPTLEAPTPEAFAAVYEALSRTTDTIIGIHFSGKLSQVPHNARLGAETLLGRRNIQVVDSLSVSVGQGALVEAAVHAAEAGASAEEVVKVVRGHIARLYGVFFTETMSYLAQVRHVGQAHALLGEMLDIKPVLALEDGDLIPIEKVRTRAQAIEKLVEYAIEFSDIARCAILQTTPRPTEDTRSLLEQLAAELPGQRWPIIPYSPALGALLGPEAMGIIVHEAEG